MSDQCCLEPGCRRSQPIRLLRSGLTGQAYFVTRWKDRGDGVIEATEKHAVPADVAALLDSLGGTPTEPVVMEMSDNTGRLLDQVLARSLDSERWTASERQAIEAMRDGLAMAGVER